MFFSSKEKYMYVRKLVRRKFTAPFIFCFILSVFFSFLSLNMLFSSSFYCHFLPLFVVVVVLGYFWGWDIVEATPLCPLATCLIAKGIWIMLILSITVCSCNHEHGFAFMTRAIYTQNLCNSVSENC